MKILITGSGCPGWYATHTAMNYGWCGQNEYLGSDCVPITVGSRIAKKNFLVPKGDSKEYLSTILSLVEKENIEMIIPLTDPELIPLSTLTSQIKIPISDTSSLEKILNKEKLYNVLPDISPSLRQVSEINSLIEVEGSCYVKLKTAHGSRGTKKIVSDKVWFEGFSTKKPEEFGSLFPLGQLSTLLNTTDLLVVETLPGVEYSIDCIFGADTELLFYGVREREKVLNGICHTAKFIVDNGEFLEFISYIKERLPMKYCINIQVKRDKEGKLKLLEINPRISGSLQAFETVGYNLAFASYILLTENKFIYKTITPKDYSHSYSYRVSTFK